MTDKIRKKVSVQMAYILRHNPSEFGLVLDKKGWTNFDMFFKVLSKSFLGITKEAIIDIVRTDSKQRYSLENDKIRANQGHSVSNVVAFDTTPLKPPEVLYHGTTWQAYQKISKEGLKKMTRHHVHLSEDVITARAVSFRRTDSPVILLVAAQKMFEDNYSFYKSDNNVWLVGSIPPKYLEIYYDL